MKLSRLPGTNPGPQSGARVTRRPFRAIVRVADHTDGGVVDIPGALLLDAWTCRLAIQTEKSALLRVWPMLVTRWRSYQFPAGLSM
jgi:hypothetical protein